MLKLSKLEKVHNLLIDCILDKEGVDTHHTVQELEEAQEYLRGILDMLDDSFCTGGCDGLEYITLREILDA